MTKFNITKSFELSEYEIMELYFESIGMKWLLDEYQITKCFVVKDEYDEYRVYQSIDERDNLIDERGELFLALCQVISNTYPNTSHRNVPIYQDGKRIN